MRVVVFNNNAGSFYFRFAMPACKVRCAHVEGSCRRASRPLQCWAVLAAPASSCQLAVFCSATRTTPFHARARARQPPRDARPPAFARCWPARSRPAVTPPKGSSASRTASPPQRFCQKRRRHAGYSRPAEKQKAECNAAERGRVN